MEGPDLGVPVMSVTQRSVTHIQLLPSMAGFKALMYDVVADMRALSPIICISLQFEHMQLDHSLY